MKNLTRAFNKASVRKGELFSITLQGLPAAGYLWAVQAEQGGVTLVDKFYSAVEGADPRTVGGPCLETFVFRAERAGTIDLTATQARPWEASRPADSCKFRIDVQ
jgi:predicted secreted protein